MEQPLSREQAIKEHRKMWNWIADEQEKHPERTISKEDYFNAHPEYKEIPQHKCWCCEYDKQYDDACDHCPIDWGNPLNICTIAPPWTLYHDFLSYRCDDCQSLAFLEVIYMRIILARKIANLPERSIIREDD